MLLSEEKIAEIIFQTEIKFCANKPPKESKERMVARAIESAVLEELAKQEPVAYRFKKPSFANWFYRDEFPDVESEKGGYVIEPLFTNAPDSAAEIARLKGMVSEIQAARHIQKNEDARLAELHKLREANAKLLEGLREANERYDAGRVRDALRELIAKHRGKEE